MKETKDIFSNQSDYYAKYRPVYPEELYNFIFSQVREFGTAWDCGTGNGQVAGVLSEKFEKVYATDISLNQLQKAVPKDNITYVHARAERVPMQDQSVDLITVAQAIHWFDFNAFYEEVRRVAKPSALLAVWGYGLLSISPKLDPIIEDFYSDTLGAYWDSERNYLDESYRTIPFPFEEIATPYFTMQKEWSLSEFLGYLSSWSSVQHYIKANEVSPVDELEKKLQPYWETDEVKPVSFPVFMRIGKV